MLVLLDEAVSKRVSRALQRAGHSVQHVQRSDLSGESDEFILGNVKGFDCLITLDAYRQHASRIAAFNAMLHDELRIIWIEAGPVGRFGAAEHVEYVMRHLDEIVALVEDPDGPALIEIIENGSRLRLTARAELDEWFRRPR